MIRRNLLGFLIMRAISAAGILLGISCVASSNAHGFFQAKSADSLETRLWVISYPDSAGVFVDDTIRGLTPLALHQISEGVHRIKVSRPGYAVFTDTVIIRDRRVDTLTATLKQFGRLVIQTEPPGAKVSLDGTVRGVAPLAIADLKPGLYRLTLELPEYHQMVRQVPIHPGDTVDLQLKLMSQYGSLTLVVDPDEGLVLVDGDSVGYGGIADYRLLTGKHDLEIVSPRYPGGVRQTFFVGGSSHVKLQARMGVSDVKSVVLSILLPGSAQLREGSIIEGLALSVGSAAACVLVSANLVRFYSARAEYDRARVDYLKASSESMALQLHGPLADKYSSLSRQKNLVTGVCVLLGGILAYNAIDVLLNHQITANIVEPLGDSSDGVIGLAPFPVGGTQITFFVKFWGSQ